MKLYHLILLIVVVFYSCSNDESNRIYEEIDLFELDDFIWQSRSDFENHYKHFYVQEYDKLPYYGFQTEQGVYEMKCYTVNESWPIISIWAGYQGTESREEAIERMRRIANAHFKTLPVETNINIDLYSLDGPETVEVENLDEFYNNAIEDKLESIKQFWIIDDYIYQIALRNNHVSVSIYILMGKL
ncbi:hypothetical protein [Marinifilum fragile]|uniref:hypothetical protein n=1 Tax=Marinifilum fragile TaxID=570161 RepID=UPI0012FB2371|nr:hypothetical protein [Marinifilum fragile]